jgi:hypothetical protein
MKKIITQFTSGALKPGLHIILVDGVNRSQSFKVLKE